MYESFEECFSRTSKRASGKDNRRLFYIVLIRRCPLGLRSCPQRPDENQNESHLQPDQTTTILLQSRRTCGCADFLSAPVSGQYQHRHAHHDRGHDAVFPLCDVRKERHAIRANS